MGPALYGSDGETPELAFMDLRELSGRPASTEPPTRQLPDPVWPVPTDDRSGQVWIADDFIEPTASIDGLWIEIAGELVPVTRYDGVAISRPLVPRDERRSRRAFACRPLRNAREGGRLGPVGRGLCRTALVRNRTAWHVPPG